MKFYVNLLPVVIAVMQQFITLDAASKVYIRGLEHRTSRCISCNFLITNDDSDSPECSDPCRGGAKLTEIFRCLYQDGFTPEQCTSSAANCWDRYNKKFFISNIKKDNCKNHGFSSVLREDRKLNIVHLRDGTFDLQCGAGYRHIAQSWTHPDGRIFQVPRCSTSDPVVSQQNVTTSTPALTPRMPDLRTSEPPQQIPRIPLRWCEDPCSGSPELSMSEISSCVSLENSDNFTKRTRCACVHCPSVEVDVSCSCDTEGWVMEQGEHCTLQDMTCQAPPPPVYLKLHFMIPAALGLLLFCGLLICLCIRKPCGSKKDETISDNNWPSGINTMAAHLSQRPGVPPTLPWSERESQMYHYPQMPTTEGRYVCANPPLYQNMPRPVDTPAQLGPLQGQQDSQYMNLDPRGQHGYLQVMPQ